MDVSNNPATLIPNVNINLAPANRINRSQFNSISINENQQVVMDNKSGSVHLIGLDNTKSIKELYDQHLHVGETFIVAAKLLTHEKLTKSEKKLKEAAKAVLDCYDKEPNSTKKSKMNDLEKALYAQQLNEAGLAIKEHAYRQDERYKAKEADSKIKVFADHYVKEAKDAKQKIILDFKNIGEYGSAHSSNGPDFVRHVMGGMIFIVENNQISFKKKMASEDLNEQQRVDKLKKRTQEVLNLFATKVTHNISQEHADELFEGIQDLVDAIASSENEGEAFDAIEKHFENWAKSDNPALQHLCRLLHAASQLYDAAMVKGPKLLVNDNDLDDCPNRILNLKGLELKEDKATRRIVYQFDNDSVKVTHWMTLNVIFPPAPANAKTKAFSTPIQVIQIVMLEAKLDDLENWDSQILLQIRAEEKSGIYHAELLKRIFELAEMETELITPKI